MTDAEVSRYMKVSDLELSTRHGDELVFSNPLHHFVFALATNKTYENVARYALGRLEPDLMMVYFEAIDSVSHLFMKYTDPPLSGIPEELREHIFYPMVTSKPNGTGLGLSIAQDIVAQHGGSIECSSRPGITIFRIYLPLENGHD